MKNTYDFLKRHGMHYEDIDLAQATRQFADEMRRGLAGEDSSLLMIPTYVGVSGEVPRGREMIVLDAGGTNLRIATVKFDEGGKATVGHFEKHPMPGTKGELGFDEFFDTLAGYIEPISGVSDTVGFCFSFPTEILPSCDGRLIAFNKEVRVRDSAGCIVGDSINKALARKGLPPKRFIILNDTVATMLGGIADAPKADYDGYIGFILGTGTNTCYIERVSNIVKLGGGDGLMAINMESGGFDRFPRGDYDLAMDAQCDNEGDHQYEKMVSGAYQGKVIYLTLLGAADEGLLSAAAGEKLREAGELTMRDIDMFCEDTAGDNLLSHICAGDADREVIYDVIDCSFERAAREVCVNFSGILECTDTGADSARPVCISAEGTTFYKSVLFRPKLDKYIAEFTVGKLGRHVAFVKAEDATLVGSAVAGLMN